MRDSRSRRRNSRRSSCATAVVEALDRRTLLSVAFNFTINDPNNYLGTNRSKLQTLLVSAGGLWASHLNVPDQDVTLEYEVDVTANAPSASVIAGSEAASFGLAIPLMTGAPKSVVKIGTDTFTANGLRTPTGDDVYEPGTVTEMLTGVDPNGAKPDAGITVYAPSLKYAYFDPNTNQRTDPMPAGTEDVYSAILHEMAHTLGWLSATDPNTFTLDSNFMYGYDQHLTLFSFNSGQQNFFLNSFGYGTQSIDPTTGETVIDPNSDNSYKVYGDSPQLSVGNLAELGTGRTIVSPTNPDVPFANFNNIVQDDLSTDLMGDIPKFGERKVISKLDLAILKDAGVPVNLNLDTSPQGILEVDGTGNSDKINITLSNGTLLIRVNDALQSYTPTQSQGITAIVINGLAGDDYIAVNGTAPAIAINGGAGNDTIIGGPKGDSLSGGGGNDLIYGEGGGDVLHGNDGKDTLYGQGGSDHVFGDGSNDYVDGGDQTDHVDGGSGNDVVVGGTGDDFLNGSSGNDLISGAGGKDRMNGGTGSDTFFGGNGNDSVDYSGDTDGIGIIASIDGVANDGLPGESDNIQPDVENIIGTPFGDKIVGSDGPNSLMGGSGNDTIDGAGGNDTLEGNDGDDVLIGSGGNDSLIGGTGNDQLIGLDGNNIMLGEDGDDVFTANNGLADTVDGGNGNDSGNFDSIDSITNVENPLTGNPLPG